MIHCIGIDVSKSTLDACSLTPNGKTRHRQFANDPVGWAKLLRWAPSLGSPGAEPAHYCLEATGALSEGVALFLAESEARVSVENPHRIKHFGIGAGFINKTDRNKTDRADARIIALYCQKHDPAPWRMSVPEVRVLVALLRRLEALKTHLVQEKNRLSEPGLTREVLRSIKTSIQFLEKEIDRLQDDVRSHIDRHPKLKGDKELLLSIPGIGECAAHWILAEMPDVATLESAQSAAAYAGLSPRVHRSGTSINKPTRICRVGNARLRTALYMPAMSAIQHNPLIKSFFDRLVAAGKPRKAALIAAMRKLLMICYGVLKSQSIFTSQPAAQPS